MGGTRGVAVTAWDDAARRAASRGGVPSLADVREVRGLRSASRLRRSRSHGDHPRSPTRSGGWFAAVFGL